MSNGTESEQPRGNLDEIVSFIDSIIQTQPTEATSALLEGLFSFLKDKDYLSAEQLAVFEACLDSLKGHEAYRQKLVGDAVRVSRPLGAHVSAYFRVLEMVRGMQGKIRGRPRTAAQPQAVQMFTRGSSILRTDSSDAIDPLRVATCSAATSASPKA